MKVKICGLKNYKDANFALSLGATELGFIFAKSPRAIDVMDAKLICRNLPENAMTIGVFKDESFDQMSETIQEVGLKGIQLHGSETPEVIKSLKMKFPALVVFKAIGVKEESFSLNPENYSMCDALIFDSSASHFHPHLRSPINSKKLESTICSQPIYLAGGINPDNVSDLISRYRPSGIDVSSGIEIAPGIKDQRLMQNLFLRLKDTL
jgi:phosphoribosylanthranilate isomerase